MEVLGREEHSYNSTRVQDDSPLQLDDADGFLPPIIITEAPLENPSPPGCSHPLGLTTGDVLDWQISASSSYPSTWDAGCQVKYARLHQPNGRAWCAGRKAAGEWVLVDLDRFQVTGLMTQGKGDDEEWVTSFELSYSLDAYHWHYARDIYNNKKRNQSVERWSSRPRLAVPFLLASSPQEEIIAPSKEAQPTLGPWTRFEPVRLETPLTPNHVWFHCTTA
ncbi:EGF-like repeat and discoidin I-like domain-containing protein 3 [Portunus trituberculatus]|uniref:EGF-like repeat and discoidin I-like domain-containing protein 3 n=1 Tax=Portunus trituberculatus TaxID=210409 RepID=A0A5B7CQV8_PORTR|nr:EGF-like repeat and discoidin I-like domain-containing protein 3 [Portunus trituberculatus]